MPRLTAIRKRALDEMMKEAIFEATVAVLTEYGVEGMTMDRVAAAAGVAKGSLYNYFESKKDLLLLVHAKTVEPIFAALDAIIATEQPAIDKLNEYLHRLLEHVAKHARVFKLLFENDAAQEALQSSQRSTREAASQRLAAVFRQGIDEGVFRPADPLVLARILKGVCIAVFDGRPELDRPDQRESVRRLILSIFLNGAATEKGRMGLGVEV